MYGFVLVPYCTKHFLCLIITTQKFKDRYLYMKVIVNYLGIVDQ